MERSRELAARGAATEGQVIAGNPFIHAQVKHGSRGDVQHGGRIDRAIDLTSRLEPDFAALAGGIEFRRPDGEQRVAGEVDIVARDQLDTASRDPGGVDLIRNGDGAGVGEECERARGARAIEGDVAGAQPEGPRFGEATGIEGGGKRVEAGNGGRIELEGTVASARAAIA